MRKQWFYMHCGRGRVARQRLLRYRYHRTFLTARYNTLGMGQLQRVSIFSYLYIGVCMRHASISFSTFLLNIFLIYNLVYAAQFIKHVMSSEKGKLFFQFCTSVDLYALYYLLNRRDLLLYQRCLKRIPFEEY